MWPANPEVFRTNPLGIQFGAAGIAFYLQCSTGRVPDAVIEWIRKGLRGHACPPSLYNGLAGVALLLLHAGYWEEAEAIMRTSLPRDLIYEDPSLYYGAAGWGMANLHFWHATRADRYLEQTQEVADHLLRTAGSDEHGLFWNHRGIVNFGLGHGQSGVAIFLLSAHAALADKALLQAAERALNFELAHSKERDNVILWHEHRGVNAGPLLPYTRWGTAGVGAAALRMFAVTGDPRFRRIADRCAHTAAARNSNKFWQDFGLAGCGEFLLDMYRFLGDTNYLHNAYYIASGILPNRIDRTNGIAFAGRDQLRIACDFGMGSAGIGCFLHRLLNPKMPRLLFLDELLTSREQVATSASQLGYEADAVVA